MNKAIWPKPMPIVWVIGDAETGKSTFIASIDPVRPGQETRTLITDLEGSTVAMAADIPMERIDIRALTEEKCGPDYKLKDLFRIWWDYIKTIEPGKYTVLGVDPSSDLYLGAHAWVKDNPGYFGKPEGAFRGKEGTMYAWGDAKVLWKQIGTMLSAKVQTVVLTSHIKDVYADGERTGKYEARGTDFRELATLSLWLAREKVEGKPDKLWAKVEKSRLTFPIWPEDATEDDEPLWVDMLPTRLEPKRGQSYPSLIRQYMQAPQPDYGDLDILDYDPATQLLSEEEKAAQELELLRQRNQILLAEEKRRIVSNLTENYDYADANEVRRTIHELDLDDRASQLDMLDELEQRLIDHKAKEPVDA